MTNNARDIAKLGSVGLKKEKRYTKEDQEILESFFDCFMSEGKAEIAAKVMINEYYEPPTGPSSSVSKKMEKTSEKLKDISTPLGDMKSTYPNTPAGIFGDTGKAIAGANANVPIGNTGFFGFDLTKFGKDAANGMKNLGGNVDGFIKQNLPDFANSDVYKSIAGGASGLTSWVSNNPLAVPAGIGIAAALIVGKGLFGIFRKMKAKSLLKKVNAARAAKKLPPIPMAAVQDPKAFIAKVKSGEIEQ